jgi:hypothetical protein
MPRLVSVGRPIDDMTTARRQVVPLLQPLGDRDLGGLPLMTVPGATVRRSHLRPDDEMPA